MQKLSAPPKELTAHRQPRAMLTRDHLLRAARTVFARDGFEHTRIEDIAALAGKTRGAFYANFADKEDVFYAIFEENATRDMEQLAPLLAGLPPAQREEALADYLIQISNDRERMLLNLEFKLYAIRHDLKRQRLAELYTCMCLRNCLPELTRLLPQLAGSDSSRNIGLFPISGILDGLALNHLFNPELLDKEESAGYLRLCLHKLLSASPLPAKTRKKSTAAIS